jgi:phage shock protein PspC (stress-responsive transcriptional regulator)
MVDIDIYRSQSNRMLLGVCGGLAEHFGVSSKLVRLATIFLAIFLPGISIWGVLFAYIALGILLPKDDNLRT